MNAAAKQAKLSLKNNRKFKIFLFFLILTSIIWLLIELSKTYTSTVNFKVEYRNLPKDKLLQSKPIVNLEGVLKGPGFSLLKHNIIHRKLLINLKSITKGEKTYYILPNNQLQNLNAQLTGDIELLRILNDTIFIDLGLNISKKVPVASNVSIDFKLGYNLTNELKFSPDSIVITGPKNNIDSIKEIQTKAISLKDIYKNIDIDIALILPPKTSNVQLSATKIHVKAEVDKFTEGRFLLPVEVINVPDSLKINPFPKEIEVIYQVGLSNFNKINKNSLSIVFDYKQYENDSLVKYLTPVIKQKSEFISSIKINPRQIEFLIQK